MQKSILKLLLFGLFSLALYSNAAATSLVHFKGGAENFVFYSDGSWTDADLFGGLKNMLPGDSRTESITIKNSADEYDYIKIYLRAEPTTTEMTDLLTQLTLNIYNNGELISGASAAEQGTLETDIELGTFNYGDELLLTAEIIAPTSLGNDYMHTQGEIKWVFTAEAYKDGKIVNPDTGAMTINQSYAISKTLIVSAITLTIILGATWLIRQKKA